MSEKPQSSHTFNTLALLGVIGGVAIVIFNSFQRVIRRMPQEIADALNNSQDKKA